MRGIAFILLVTVVGAQAHPGVSGHWVGPLEFQDHRGRLIIPTRVTLKIDSDTITGDWVSLTTARSSGIISGGWDNKGRIKLRVRMASGAEINGVKIAPERCSADTTFTGELVSEGFVLRLTSPKIVFDTVQDLARDKNCGNLTNLVWTLQRRE